MLIFIPNQMTKHLKRKLGKKKNQKPSKKINFKIVKTRLEYIPIYKHKITNTHAVLCQKLLQNKDDDRS